MLHMITMLESIGVNARLRHAPQAALGRTLDAHKVSDAVRQAILMSDSHELRRLLADSRGELTGAGVAQGTMSAWREEPYGVQSNQGGWRDEPHSVQSQQTVWREDV
ncbi:MAG: hypothetical protein AB1832_13345 [Pseudomonadota bacterium]